MALTGTITTDMAPVQTATIASGAGVIGVGFSNPSSLVVTDVHVTWGVSDAATAAALVVAINADTTVNTYITAAQVGSTGALTLTYSGVVGLPCVLTVTGAGSGLSLSVGALGIYSDGQTATVTMNWTSSGLAALTVTGVDRITTGQTITDDSDVTMVGSAIPASATTTFVFPAVIRSGQIPQITVGLNWSIVCGSTVGTCTTFNVAVAPPAFLGSPFPNEGN